VERWLTKKIPIIVAAHQQQPAFSGGRFKFEFWTCGGFEDDAIQLLKEAKSRTKKYDLDWKGGLEIREYAKQLSAPGIKKILMEHYFEHPTASLNS
jgi:hypothetical protein